MRIFRITKILTYTLFSALVVMNAEAVVVDKFHARLYGQSDLKELEKKDFVRMIAVELFKDSLRTHYDLLRYSEKKPKLLQSENWKYFLTLYDVIPNEIAKAMFSISINGDSVNYASKNASNIIECNSKGYKDISDYSPSNWNYLLLINVLNRVVNTETKIDEALIYNTARDIDNKYKNKYVYALKKAEKDIKTYFDELDLYKYLQKCKKCRDDIIANITSKNEEGILMMPTYFASINSSGYMGGNNNGGHSSVYTLLSGDINYAGYKIRLKEDDKSFYSEDIHDLTQQLINIMQKKELSPESNDYDNEFKQQVMAYLLPASVQVVAYNRYAYHERRATFINEILKKAEYKELTNDEKIFLKIYKLACYYTRIYKCDYTSPFIIIDDDKWIPEAMRLSSDIWLEIFPQDQKIAVTQAGISKTVNDFLRKMGIPDSDKLVDSPN